MKLSRTVQRKVIVDELRKLKCHPTADELYEVVRKRLPRISLGTVYRNLEQLSQAGIIQKLETAGKQRRFDGDLRKHYHFRCECCGAVVDIEDERLDAAALRIAELLPRLGADGFHLELSGRCVGCRSVEREVSRTHNIKEEG